MPVAARPSRRRKRRGRGHTAAHPPRLPAAAEGEFYHADLIGLAAVDPEGKRIGEIVAVQNYGAGDLLEVRLAGSGKTELVPFTQASVPEVDIASGRVMVAMPAASNEE